MPNLLVLGPNEVAIWVARPEAWGDAVQAHYDALMTDAERSRQRAFVFEKNRRESLVTRGLVRTTLSRYRAVAAGEWRFRTNEWGRPEIDPPCGLHFNLSNHPSMVVCAVSEGRAIGVDVEPIARGKDILEMADTVFAPSELAELRALPEASRPDRAVALWTLKESYIKARGMGLSLPLDRFAMRFHEGAITVEVRAPIVDDAARWTFRIVDRDGHRIALCVEGDRSLVVACLPFEPEEALGALPAERTH